MSEPLSDPVTGREVERPALRRLAMERDDPAAAWLTWSDRARAMLWGAVPSAVAFGLCSVAPMVWAVGWAARHPILRSRQRPSVSPAVWLAFLLASGGAWLTFAAVRWAGAQLKARAVRRLARRRALDRAQAVDDWGALNAAPDGQIVSVVGWVRGRGHLGHRVDGRVYVGLVLDCRGRVTELRPRGRSRRGPVPYLQPHELLLEALHDFDLVDDAGRSLPILAAGARLLGDKNVAKLGGDDVEEQKLLASLDIPLEVTPIGDDAFVLHDGDPVLVVGFKTTVVDPAEPARRAPPLRVAVASGAGPLLVMPIVAAARPSGRAPIRS